MKTTSAVCWPTCLMRTSSSAPMASAPSRAITLSTPCILSEDVHSGKKLGRGRPSPPKSCETVGEQGRHAQGRQVRARTVVRTDKVRIAMQGREEPGGGGMEMAEQVVVGIDVSKAKLDIVVLPSNQQFTVSNDRAGIARLLQVLRPLAPSRVVLEATGKLERLAVSELAGAGLTVAVVNPGQVRHYAKARGKRAKTDPIDARLIAEFARDLKPEFHPLPDAETQALAALCQRRNQLLEMQQ